MGDAVPRLIDQIRSIEYAAQSIGLELNHAKCEIIGLSQSQRLLWDSSGLSFIVRSANEACLLGAPLSLEGTDLALQKSCSQLVRIRERLMKLSAHEAFFVLKIALVSPDSNTSFVRH